MLHPSLRAVNKQRPKSASLAVATAIAAAAFACLLPAGAAAAGGGSSCPHRLYHSMLGKDLVAGHTEALCLLNEKRRQYGLAPLRDSRLGEAAAKSVITALERCNANFHKKYPAAAVACADDSAGNIGYGEIVAAPRKLGVSSPPCFISWVLNNYIDWAAGTVRGCLKDSSFVALLRSRSTTQVGIDFYGPGERAVIILF